MQSEVRLDTGGEIVNAIEFLIRAYEFDLHVLSNPWMYLPALIPVLIYIPFMLLKWWVLTCPFWIPFTTITKALSSNKGNQ